MTNVEETAKKIASDGKDFVASELETLKKSFSQLRTDLTSLVGSAVDGAKSGAHIAGEKAAAVADGVKNKIGDIKDKGMEKEKALEEKIADHPIASVVIAFGVGFYLARLLPRFRR